MIETLKLWEEICSREFRIIRFDWFCFLIETKSVELEVRQTDIEQDNYKALKAFDAEIGQLRVQHSRAAIIVKRQRILYKKKSLSASIKSLCVSTITFFI